MQIEIIKIADLSLDSANARKHNKKNIEAIKTSLKKFGQQKPIIIDASNVVRAGNGTLIAAQELGYKEIKCVRSELPQSELIAYALADNRTAELAEWDNEVILDLLEALKEDAEDDYLDTLGFDQTFIDGLLNELVEETKNNNDELVEELNEKPVEKQKTKSRDNLFKFAVTAEESETILAAIDKFKASQDNYSMSDGQALQAIALIFLNTTLEEDEDLTANKATPPPF